MFLDYVVNIDVNAPKGLVTRNNLFQYSWIVEKDEKGDLNSPKLVKGKDFNKYFDNKEMVEFGKSLGSKEVYLLNKTNLSNAHDTCFWLVDSLGILSSLELSIFKGFKVNIASRT